MKYDGLRQHQKEGIVRIRCDVNNSIPIPRRLTKLSSPGPGLSPSPPSDNVIHTFFHIPLTLTIRWLTTDTHFDSLSSSQC